MFTNLVVALDGSECANHALELALTLAKAGGGELAICSVADPAPLYGSLEPAAMAEQTLLEINRNAERIVDEGTAKAAAAGVASRGKVLEGEPAREIVKYAAAERADAIVMGTHGRSGLTRLLMGSIAEGVLRSASMPVLTVRREAHLAPIPTAEASS